MSKTLWLAFGAAFGILLCLYSFGGAWTAAVLAVAVVLFLGWKFLAPRLGRAGEQGEANRKRAEKEGTTGSAHEE